VRLLLALLAVFRRRPAAVKAPPGSGEMAFLRDQLRKSGCWRPATEDDRPKLAPRFSRSEQRRRERIAERGYDLSEFSRRNTLW
jgi:hypothetical protein